MSRVMANCPLVHGSQMASFSHMGEKVKIKYKDMATKIHFSGCLYKWVGDPPE